MYLGFYQILFLNLVSQINLIAKRFYNRYGQSKRINMNTTTVSSKFQIVIPREIRNSMKIKAGQKLQLIQFDDRIEIMPIKEISSMRGFIKNRTNDFERDESERV